MAGGRPRKYSRPEEGAQAHAERERARRRRTLAVERAAVTALLQAVEEAAAAGDAVARSVKSGTPESLLRNLAHWFRSVAGSPGEELRPRVSGRTAVLGAASVGVEPASEPAAPDLPVLLASQSD